LEKIKTRFHRGGTGPLEPDHFLRRFTYRCNGLGATESRRAEKPPWDWTPISRNSNN